ncbi:MAG: nucleotidyl transferase AbiEii/AbiGii toxin family protein [Bacteroidales bacterium]|nr:nucleotidyl transferase AbiEii/AbiGii toxin family protein [Bacteroidales bacterium]
MINLNSIDIKWINNVSKANRKADMTLVEKTIRAFVLLEGLATSGLPFVFKGGTSLMLLTKSSKRMSIDIDIIMPDVPSHLTEMLEDIAQKQGFIRVESQERNGLTKVPKMHYKFWYNPIHRTANNEDCVLLDILTEQVQYSDIKQVEISSKFLPMAETKTMVNIPGANDLLGDKLTAFAPNTTGVPYFKHGNSMNMEINKQLYDVACLFDLFDDINSVKNTFEKIAGKELSYRESDNITTTDVLDDIFQTSLCISTRGMQGKGMFEELMAGIKRVNGFIFSEPYQIDKAIVCASKAAYLSALIKSGASEFERFVDSSQIKDWQIEQTEYNKLNKLKKSNAEAFFYWYKACTI